MQDIHNHSRVRAHQRQQSLKCPRCDSINTKFCYYNNYNLSQPRHFCKTCRRYWTKGGLLRNVPVGGGCRKTKPKHPSSSSAAATARPGSDGSGIERSGLIGEGSSDGGGSSEMGSFMSTVSTAPSNETTAFGFGGNTVNLDHLKVEEGDTVNQPFYDRTAQIEFLCSDEYTPLDWGGGGEDQALYDLTTTVDHAYWSQSQWMTDLDHHDLYL